MSVTTAKLLQIERAGLWPDFHAKFINYWQEQLAISLPTHYEARVGEQVNLFELDDSIRRFSPDVAIVAHDSSPTGREISPREAVSSGVAVLEPVTVPLAKIYGEVQQLHIEVIHRPDRSLVSVLELLSPSNKSEPGRALYLAKRRGLLASPVHLVELDLLQGGKRVPFAAALPAGDFFYMLSRLELRFDCQVYASHYGDPFGPWPVPLRSPDPDVVIDYQALFELTYTRGRYEQSMERSS